MPEVTLGGELVCSTDSQAETVARHLPVHIELSRAEDGCLSFEVTQTEDPLIWHVEERFRDPRAFRAHQERVAASEWGSATAGIERRYMIRGMDAEGQS